MRVHLTTGGSIVDLPDDAARSMIEQGHATSVEPAPGSPYSVAEHAAVVAARVAKASRALSVADRAMVEADAIAAAHDVKTARLAAASAAEETQLAGDVAIVTADLGTLLSATSAPEPK